MVGRIFVFVFVFSLVSSCEKKIEGCTDITATNYDNEANTDDGSCVYKYSGKAVFWYDQTTMNQLNSSGAAWIDLFVDGSLAFTWGTPINTYESVAPDCSNNTASSIVKKFEFLSQFGQSYTYVLKKDDGTVLQSLPFFVTANTCTPVELFF